MGRSSNSPTLFDECRKIAMSFLIKEGYLVQRQWKSGTISWFRGGERTGWISIVVDFTHSKPVLELEYNYNKIPTKYTVQMTSQPSNLGKGVLWYFICPTTGLRCRKLYSVGRYFLHRSAFRGCFYEKQIQSKKYREIERVLGPYFKHDEIYDQLHRKNFKKYYKGTATKKYKKIMQILRRADAVPQSEIERVIFR